MLDPVDVSPPTEAPGVHSVSATRGAAVHSPLSHVKRFLEYLRADPARVEQARADAPAIARRLSLAVDPGDFRALWDGAHAKRVGAAGETSLERAYRARVESLRAFRDRMRAGSRPRDSRLAAWRERQIARARLELGEAKNEQIVHAPYAIELSRGCSVGCWFCGVSAPRLSDVFRYTPDNAETWRGIVGALAERLGAAARFGFCYWATDPLDNPDYERFCLDLHAITGGFPQTTTALPMRDPARVRRLLDVAERHDGPVNRFSVLTLRQLDEIHGEYSPEELDRVEVIPQNRESPMGYADAGRARRRRLRRAEADVPERADAAGRAGTIACVSGLLVNMLERSMKLVSPCRADERWPDGYVVFAEARFRDADDFAARLDTMLGDGMAGSVRERARLRFVRRLRYERTADGFVLAGSHAQSRHEHPTWGAWLGAIGDAVHGGRSSPTAVALEMALRFGVPETATERALEAMLRAGLLDEETD